MDASAVLSDHQETGSRVVPTPLSLMSVSLLQGTLITVSGELDATNVAMLERYVAEHHPDPGRPLVLDLGGLSFLDSSGLGLLIHLRGQGGTRGSLHLAALQSRPAHLMEITGALRHFDVHPTLEQALQAAGPFLA